MKFCHVIKFVILNVWYNFQCYVTNGFLFNFLHTRGLEKSSESFALIRYFVCLWKQLEGGVETVNLQH